MKKQGFKTSIGGQALIEGVMMRGPSKIAYAVRKPDKQIELRIKEIKDLSKRYKILKLPIIRGAYKLIDSMVIGVEALTYSASFWEEDTSQDDDQDYSIFLTVAGSIVLALLFFMILPSLLASFFGKYISQALVFNFIEGGFRLLIFMLYLYLISKNKDIERVFQYHGAEHKSIACYEDGQDLTIENVRKYPRTHPRCGTSFLFMVMILSIFILSLFGWPNLILRSITRILLFPLIAGISYEINRLIGKYDNRLTFLLRLPGLRIQSLATVKEPDDQQIQVGIESLRAVLPTEGEDDTWN